ncbi:DUF7344 domain-containing protein (plasmid) [Haloferacaceae archaeon DSL9]
MSTLATTEKTHVSGVQETTNHESQARERQEPESLSLDLVFEVLKNERRRHVLRYLEQNPGTASLSDLAEHIAAIENDKPVASLTSQERKRVYVGLYQCHLPKMDDTDVIAFDDNRGTVDVGPNADQLYTLLEQNESTTEPWHHYYLGATGASAALFVGTFALAAELLTGAFVLSVLLFAALSVYHATTRQ